MYGRSKLAGDLAIAASGCKHLIFRTTWVYGPRGRNFLLTMLSLAAGRDELRVVADQRGAPTSSLFLADATARAIRSIPRQGGGLGHLQPVGRRRDHLGGLRERHLRAGRREPPRLPSLPA